MRRTCRWVNGIELTAAQRSLTGSCQANRGVNGCDFTDQYVWPLTVWTRVLTRTRPAPIPHACRIKTPLVLTRRRS